MSGEMYKVYRALLERGLEIAVLNERAVKRLTTTSSGFSPSLVETVIKKLEFLVNNNVRF
jgi:hypothetical protein